MSMDMFDSHVRPNLPREAILGRRVMFHRVDLEAWAENYMAAAAEPGRPNPLRKLPWQSEQTGSSNKRAGSGRSTKESPDMAEYRKVVGLETGRSRKPPPPPRRALPSHPTGTATDVQMGTSRDQVSEGEHAPVQSRGPRAHHPKAPPVHRQAGPAPSARRHPDAFQERQGEVRQARHHQPGLGGRPAHPQFGRPKLAGQNNRAYLASRTPPDFDARQGRRPRAAGARLGGARQTAEGIARSPSPHGVLCAQHGLPRGGNLRAAVGRVSGDRGRDLLRTLARQDEGKAPRQAGYPSIRSPRAWWTPAAARAPSTSSSTRETGCEPSAMRQPGRRQDAEQIWTYGLTIYATHSGPDSGKQTCPHGRFRLYSGTRQRR